MGLNISFVIPIPYGKKIQKCKNSNFPAAPTGTVARAEGLFARLKIKCVFTILFSVV